MGLLNEAPTFLRQFGAYFVLSFFFPFFFSFLFFFFLCSVKICVWQRSFDMIAWSLWRGIVLPLALPAEINCSQLKIGGLRIRLRFLILNSKRAEKKNQVRLKDLVFHSEFQKGIQRKPKRKEQKWEEFKSTRRILFYIQNSKRKFKFSTS